MFADYQAFIKAQTKVYATINFKIVSLQMTMTKSSIKIRIATLEDAALLAGLSASTFIETYWGTDTEENILQHIDAYFNETQIREEIANLPTEQYYIAETDTEAVGYIKVRNDSVLKPDYLQTKEALEIARLYVKKSHHGQKIGLALLQYTEKYAEQEGFEVLWLCVWKENAKALLFYQNYGFGLTGEYLFQLGTSTYIDWAMSKKISF